MSALRRIGSWLLTPWLDRSEREAVLADLDDLSGQIARRRGPVVALLWYGWQLLKYPVYLTIELGTSARRGPAGGLERWARDIRLGVRRIARRPMASAVIVLTLALGIGAGTAVYSVLNTLVLRPLPFRDSDRLVRVRESVRMHGTGEPRQVVMTPRRYELLRDRATVFEDVAAARYRTFTLSGDGEPERVIGLWATWNHFTVLGVEPALGRAYGPDEDAAGAPAPVAVISNSLWVRRFGGDENAIGAELEINGRPHTVLGVMPRGFRYPYAGEVWVPMGIHPDADDYERGALNVTARLADGAEVASLDRALSELSQAMALERPDPDANQSFVFRTLQDEILEGVPEKVVALLWAAVFVLLIGAANVASMILARLHAEERELHVQVALGAGRSDLVRRFVAEGLVLTVLGLTLGLVTSSLTVGRLTALSPVSDMGPYFQDFRVDAVVVAFGALLALGAVALASMPTLLRLRRGELGGLRGHGLGTGRGGRGLPFMDGLVAAELAIAVMLLAGAGLTVETVREQWNAGLGIQSEGLFTFGVAPTSSGYADPEERIAYVDDVLARIAALPGVDAVGLTTLNPMRSHGWGAAVWPEGQAPTGAVDFYTLNHRAVTPGYFEAAGTKLLAGRGILASDGVDDPGVVVLSERTARLFWPDQDAVGRSLRVGAASADGPLLTVVGVVEDVQEYDFLDETWYRPFPQDPRDYNTRVLEIFVRSNLEGAVLIPQVREAIRAVDARIPIFNVQTMADILRFERKVEAFATLLLSLFAAIGILLSAVGVYGVLSYTAGRRTRELGLRVALGASRMDIVRSVAYRTAWSCAVGLAAGLGATAVGMRFLGTIVPGVPTFATNVFAWAALGTLAVALVAALGPTLRALRIHPRTALAGE